MSDMPSKLYVGRNALGGLHVWPKDEHTTKYIRADIAEARIAKLEEVLRWYGDIKTYSVSTKIHDGNIFEPEMIPQPIISDKGQRAREVLKDEK